MTTMATVAIRMRDQDTMKSKRNRLMRRGVVLGVNRNIILTVLVQWQDTGLSEWRTLGEILLKGWYGPRKTLASSDLKMFATDTICLPASKASAKASAKGA